MVAENFFQSSGIVLQVLKNSRRQSLEAEKKNLHYINHFVLFTN